MEPEPPVKRGRGRPRKSVEADAVVAPKGKRGRPPKGDEEGGERPQKTRKTISIPMEFEGTLFSNEVSEVLTRLDSHTFSKPLRKCFLGIVREVVALTRAECQKSNGTVDPALISSVRPVTLGVPESSISVHQRL